MREQLARVRELNQRTLELERQIMLLVIRLAPSLLAIPGCGALTAAKIVGETAGVERFRSKAAYARWNGTAPQPVWTGNTTRYRLARCPDRLARPQPAARRWAPRTRERADHPTGLYHHPQTPSPGC